MSKKGIALALLVGCCIVFVEFKMQRHKQLVHQNLERDLSIEQNAGVERNLSIYRELYAKPVGEWAKPNIDKSVENEWQEFAPLPGVEFPADNPYSDIKVFLGMKLFNEPRLSKSGQIACQSCHHPELAFTDGLRLSHGHDRQRGRRNAPSVLMSAFFPELLWDGRAKSLEQQILGTISNPVEMANTLERAERSIRNAPEYYPIFVAAFGDEDTKKLWAKYFPQLFEANDEKRLRAFLQNSIKIDKTVLKRLPSYELQVAQEFINIENIVKSIATYERLLAIATNSNFNQFLKGDYRFMSDKELWGLDIFRNKGRCMNCHYGAIMSDRKFHNIGLSFFGHELQDLGRYEVSNNPKDIGKFKTPSLVAVSKSAPYMHNGIFPHLISVINAYNAGFPVAVVKGTENNPLLPKTDPLIQKLNLTKEEIEALEAFLKTL